MTGSDFERVLATVRAIARQDREFTTDDVWKRLGDWVPAQHSVVGKAFSEGARRGWIEGTERFVKSARPAAKGRRVQVWRRG